MIVKQNKKAVAPAGGGGGGGGPVMFVQGNNSYSSSVTLTGVTAGNLLVVFLQGGHGGSGTISDSSGNTYFLAGARITTPDDHVNQWIYYATANASGSVTFTFGGSVADKGLHVAEFSGQSGSPISAVYFEEHRGTVSSLTPFSVPAGSATFLGNGEENTGAFESWDAGSGITLIGQNLGQGSISGYRVSATSETISPSATGGSALYQMGAVVIS